MSIETTESLLNRFDYTYKKTNNQLEINLGLGLRLTADFSNTEKVIKKEELVTWNFLTGTLDMSLKRARIYNFIGFILIVGVFTLTSGPHYGLITLMASFIILWVLLWSNYYLTKAWQMKHTLIRWNEN